MRVLMTGAAGMVGRKLTARLVADGKVAGRRISVVAVTRDEGPPNDGRDAAGPPPAAAARDLKAEAMAPTAVQAMLDVAASGVNLVERDGVSHRHPARFVLIGTMNPEEGELRPQLLDRFGLKVRQDGQPQPAERAEIVRRRLAFDADPQAFIAQWSGEQQALAHRCQDARARLPGIPLDDAALDDIAQRCFAAGVDGLRADLVWLRAARAHAAWRGAGRIEAKDIDAVEDFALAHRRTHTPPPAAQPPQSPPAASQSQATGAEGQWGELPAQAVTMGERRDLPRWPKKP